MAVLGVDDFKSKLSGGGARPNLFKVTLNPPANLGTILGFGALEGERISFMVRAASLPGSTMASIPVPFRGRQVQIAGDRTFEPWITTIYNDTDFNIRAGIEQWMDRINRHVSNTAQSASPEDYKADMIVEQLDKSSKQLYRYDFKGTFPSVLSPIELAYDANDVIEEFTCEWQVDYWISSKGTLGEDGGLGAPVIERNPDISGNIPVTNGPR